MKYSKKYIVFTLILSILIGTNVYKTRNDNSDVEAFRGATLEEDVWNPMVATDVNNREIKVVIDNKEYSSKDIDFYMDSNRNIMVPVTLLTEGLNCSAHMYDDDTLLVEKGNISTSFKLEEQMAKKDDEDYYIISPMTKKGDEYYVSLNDLSDLLDYDCSFNIEDNVITSADREVEKSNVPTKYDLRDKQRMSTIRDQGFYGTCWAFAAISALESSMLPEKKVSYSVDNMILNNSFNVNLNDGGEYTMGMAYLAGWQGPVNEKDDEYGDEKCNKKAKPVAHVQEMQILDGKNYESIKEAVFKYGGVQSSLYITLNSADNSSMYYNENKNAYCYLGTANANHDVVIIGWDDNYSKDNFSVPLEGDGAFICQNSWGDGFGDDGVFYVSYYDTNIGTHNVVYTKVEDTDNYDNIYQADLCGWVGKMGYKRESIYAANIYTAKKDETLRACGFYATASNTEYEVFVVKDFEDKKSFKNRQTVASGVLKNVGYYTVEFDNLVSLDKGEDYAIGIYIKQPGNKATVAVEYDSSESSFDDTVILDDGVGYTSKDGIVFKNVRKELNWECNLCIKAFTDDK